MPCGWCSTICIRPEFSAGIICLNSAATMRVTGRIISTNSPPRTSHAIRRLGASNDTKAPRIEELGACPRLQVFHGACDDIAAGALRFLPPGVADLVFANNNAFHRIGLGAD